MEKAQSIEHWIATLEREIVEMDLSASKAQLDTWKLFALHSEFPAAGTGVFEGWVPDRYLDWKTIEMELFLKAQEISFWRRLVEGLKWVFIGHPPLAFSDLNYSLARSSDKRAMSVKVIFEKKEGEILSRMESESL